MNEGRRTFLKVIFIGSGAFLANKILAPLFSFFEDSSAKTETYPPNKTSFKNFQIIEDKKRLSIYDNSGEEIFQIDKEA